MKKITRIILIATIITLIPLTIITLTLQDKMAKLPMTILSEVKVVGIIYCLLFLTRFKVIKLNIGMIFVLLAWSWNFVESFLIIGQNNLIELLHIMLYEISSLFGVITIIIGILEILQNNNTLVDRLTNLSFYDSLTKLPNQNMISIKCPVSDEPDCGNKKLCVCLKRKKIVHLDRKFALLYLDIDDFKQINDNMGRYYGDILLKQIADRLKSFLSSQDVIIHMSGDEFVILIYNVDNKFESFLTNIIKLINRPFILGSKEIFVSCSIGIALYPEQGKSIDEVLEKADIAMYEAKKAGKNRYIFYANQINESLNHRFDTINELKNGIMHNEFIVHYQPKALSDNGKVTGLEALVRWNHPRKGLIYPNDFIGLAEEAGLIQEIDLITLNTACKQIEKWLKEGRKPFNISVNISPIFFNDQAFITKIDDTFAKYNIDPSYISIEITESVALKDIELTKMKLRRLRRKNIKIFLDDFGKGYSSLSYLKQYPIDYLKIDKNFIDGIIDNLIDRTLVQSVIEISNIMGVKVVSEGVETIEQLEILKSIGCHEYQGYLLSKPKPIEEIIKAIF